MASGTSASADSFRETSIAATLPFCPNEQENLDRSAIDNTIIKANGSDQAATRSAKTHCAQNTVKLCFLLPSSPYFFVSYAFSTYIIRKGVSQDILSHLIEHLNYV